MNGPRGPVHLPQGVQGLLEAQGVYPPGTGVIEKHLMVEPQSVER